MKIPVRFEEGDGLLLVDVQNDFCPGGALPVPEGDRIVPVLNRHIEAAVRAGIPVFASRDWHPAGHCSFKEQGGPWPVHCVQNTWGAEFHPDLKLPESAEILSKGTRVDADSYSAFGGTGLDEKLKARGIRRLWIGGLAQDVCVRATVLDARKLGYEVHVLRDATRPVNVRPDDGERALREMQEAGAVIEGT